MDQDITDLKPAQMRDFRQDMQIVFQDPLASLDPRMTIGDSIAEPLKAFNPRMATEEVKETVREMMRRVDLLPRMINRYPHEFSGGQCQRIGIARAMILNPRLIVCDEPVSALDVSIQAQIINLLMRLQAVYRLSLLFISHDLSVVRHISHRIMVLYMGRVMEIADRDTIYGAPRHPYTRALISAVPLPDPDKERARKKTPLTGDLPSPLEPPSGCVFRTRCPLADARCSIETPALREMAPGHTVACHYG
jgi:oligopeptide transport system ATP-binding protein